MRQRAMSIPLPPSANEYWQPAIVRNRPMIVPTELALAYKRAVERLVKKHFGGVLFDGGDVCVRAVVYRPRRAGDVSNRLKVLEDALNDVLWTDDRQVARIEIERSDADPSNPRVDLWVEDYTPRPPPPAPEMSPEYRADFERERDLIDAHRARKQARKKAKAAAREGAAAALKPWQGSAAQVPRFARGLRLRPNTIRARKP